SRRPRIAGREENENGRKKGNQEAQEGQETAANEEPFFTSPDGRSLGVGGDGTRAGERPDQPQRFRGTVCASDRTKTDDQEMPLQRLLQRRETALSCLVRFTRSDYISRCPRIRLLCRRSSTRVRQMSSQSWHCV